LTSRGEQSHGGYRGSVILYDKGSKRSAWEEGQRSPVAIGEAMIKVEDLLRKDKSFEKVLKHTGKNLVNGRSKKYRISVACPLIENTRPRERKERRLTMSAFKKWESSAVRRSIYLPERVKPKI
jgi:hypothetical protein